MNKKIRIGVCGYGNLGKGVALAIGQNPDMKLSAVFTRRNPATFTDAPAGVPVISADAAKSWKDRIDVMILCGGSASDLPEQGPAMAAIFSTIDSFDTHARIPEYLHAVDTAAKAGGNFSIVSVGWDPGLFSLMRLYSAAILPQGKSYTFWGEGVSQGHSDAIRRIEGVENAIQYTVPISTAVQQIRGGETPELCAKEKHRRVCYVVAKTGADKANIERKIKEMPNYFADYNTTVYFVSAEELRENHSHLPHGGSVIRNGITGAGNRHAMEYSIKLDSNPEFTSSVLVAYARAAYRMRQRGETGARTVFDIPPVELFAGDRSDAIKELL